MKTTDPNATPVPSLEPPPKRHAKWWWVAAVTSAGAAAAIAFLTLPANQTQASDTSSSPTTYVLAHPVAASQPLHPDMLVAAPTAVPANPHAFDPTTLPDSVVAAVNLPAGSSVFTTNIITIPPTPGQTRLVTVRAAWTGPGSPVGATVSLMRVKPYTMLAANVLVVGHAGHELTVVVPTHIAPQLANEKSVAVALA